MRMTAESLKNFALDNSNTAQKPVLENLLNTGFIVTKVLVARFEKKSAICVSHPNVTGWLTADGGFHRPVKGKKSVSVSKTTLERVW